MKHTFLVQFVRLFYSYLLAYYFREAARYLKSVQQKIPILRTVH